MSVLAALTALALAAIQPALFLSTISAGRAVDLGLVRADGVALVFGTTWALASALASLRANSTRRATSTLLLLAGLLAVAYAREPLIFYAGWEIAIAGLWLTLPGKTRPSRLTAAAMHLAGLPLFVAILLGLLPPFAPPPGGAAQPWHPALVLVFAAVLLLRIWLALPTTPTQHSSLNTHHWMLALAAPILLVKALVAAPFHPFGIWMLALTGTLMMLTGVWKMLAPGSPRPVSAIAWVWLGCIVAALGLAPAAPLAAAGAVWLMLVGSLILPGQPIHNSRRAGVATAIALPGLWLIAQAALDLRYGLVAALLLPCLLIALVPFAQKFKREFDVVHSELPPSPSIQRSKFNIHNSLSAALALTLAVYPQLPIELAVRPAVQSMAGGVAALSTLALDPGVGLMVRPTQAALSAGLPTTGIFLAIFLAYVFGFWILDFRFWITSRTRNPKSKIQNPKSKIL